MLGRIRTNALAVAMSALATLTMLWLAFYDIAWNDYDDEARTSVDDLVSGHILAALHAAPVYGGSLVLRAPFAFVPAIWGGGPLAVYRLISLPCLLAAAAVGIVIVGRMRGLHRSRLARGVLLGLFVANPITIRAGEIGHPEELLSAACAIGAVLVATRGHSVWAGVLLGLAIANKEWAIVATGPVLLALPAARIRALVIAGVVVAAVLAPLLLAGGGFSSQLSDAAAVNAGSPIFQPWQVWWFFGVHGALVHGLFGESLPGYRVAAGWAVAVSHPLVILISVPCTLLAARMPRREHAPLLLLALLLLLRCELDVWDTVYYGIPFIFALASWEALTLDRPPVGALVATVMVWILYGWSPSHMAPDQQSLLFLAATLPATCLVALTLYAPSASRRPIRVPVRRTSGALESTLGSRAG